MKILLLSALPQEYAPLKKLFPALRSVRKAPPRKFVLNLPGKEISLIECGMGDGAVREALGGESAGLAPDLVIFSGFAGGLHRDLPVGTVCYTSSARRIETGAQFCFRFPTALDEFLAEHRIRPVLALTAEAPGDKQAHRTLACGKPAVLDMETASAAEEAFRRKIPFLCFRAISDPLDHELGFDLEDISDERGGVRPLLVLATIMKKPSTLASFYILWRDSGLAAKNLCGLLAAFLKLPAPELERLASGIRVEKC